MNSNPISAKFSDLPTKSRWTLAALLVGCLVLTSGCGRVSESQAGKLVERYNAVVCEAYRRGDVRLIDPVVGPNEGRKLTGLIGVRLDLGLVLDARMLSLEVTGVEQSRGGLRVHTKERWSYCDRKINTGEQVGEPSEDFYEMTYRFMTANREWVVDEIQFTSPPRVGRQGTPWITDRSTLNGVSTAGDRKEPQQP